jgi:hypothetical protein
MLAAVAGSIGVAGAAAGVAAGLAAGCSSAVSFLPHPAKRIKPNKTGTAKIAFQIFWFILSPHLS